MQNSMIWLQVSNNTAENGKHILCTQLQFILRIAWIYYNYLLFYSFIQKTTKRNKAVSVCFADQLMKMGNKNEAQNWY